MPDVNVWKMPTPPLPSESSRAKVLHGLRESRMNTLTQKSEIRNQKLTVTIVHKANVLKLTDGLFREECLKVAERISAHHHQRDAG